MIVLRAAKSQYCIYFLSRCFALLSFYSDTIWWSTCYNTRFWTLCPALLRPAVMARGHRRVSGFSLMPKVPHIRLSCLHRFTEERVMAIPNAFQRQWFQANKLFSSQFLKQPSIKPPESWGLFYWIFQMLLSNILPAFQSPPPGSHLQSPELYSQQRWTSSSPRYSWKFKYSVPQAQQTKLTRSINSVCRLEVYRQNFQTKGLIKTSDISTLCKSQANN